MVFKQAMQALLHVDAQIAHCGGLWDPHCLPKNFAPFGGNVHTGERMVGQGKVRIAEIGAAWLHEVPPTDLTISNHAVVIGDVPNRLVELTDGSGQTRRGLAHHGTQHLRKGSQSVNLLTVGTLAGLGLPPHANALLYRRPLIGCPLVDHTQPCKNTFVLTDSRVHVLLDGAITPIHPRKVSNFLQGLK